MSIENGILNDEDEDEEEAKIILFSHRLEEPSFQQL